MSTKDLMVGGVACIALIFCAGCNLGPETRQERETRVLRTAVLETFPGAKEPIIENTFFVRVDRGLPGTLEVNIIYPNGSYGQAGELVPIPIGNTGIEVPAYYIWPEPRLRPAIAVASLLPEGFHARISIYYALGHVRKPEKAKEHVFRELRQVLERIASNLDVEALRLAQASARETDKH